MVPEIDIFLRSEIAPFLAAAGYQKDKRIYRRFGADGVCALVGFLPERTEPGIVGFDVECGVWVPVARPWLSAQLQAEVAAKPITIESAQYRVQLAAPPEFDLLRLVPTRPRSSRTWGFRMDGTQATAAQALRAGLADLVFPVLDRALAGERDADVLGNPTQLPVTSSTKPFTRPQVWC